MQPGRPSSRPRPASRSPDQSQLGVSEDGGVPVWNFLIAEDRTLCGSDPVYRRRTLAMGLTP